MKRKKIIITALLALFVSTVFGQKVGLVLSGGGAKGLYHIGVLRALEENQIPVDYIAGTSMGAIVSGLYATGYTPQQMNEIFISDRVGYWMSGKIENDYYFYFKKARSTASMVNLLLDVEGRRVAPILPANLIPSRQIDLAFIEFFAGVNAQSNNNFDSLMIPFRCVATDLIGRREVVFSGGDMGQAIRASMTIPFVFRPLRKDSTLYYDGGIVNNFPWTVMQKDFAPDIIIGSKCTEGNVVPHEDNIIDQISAITMLSTNYELPSQSGILIEHAFSDVSMLDFSKAQYVIDKGYTDAMEMMPAILERISRRVDTTELAIRRSEYRASLPEVNFDSYTIEGVGGNQNTYIEKMLNLGDEQEGFKPFSFERFKTRYFRLLAEGDIDAFYPDVIYDKSKELFSIGLKLNNKPSLKFLVGGNVSSTSMNQAYLGLEYRLIQKKAHRFNLDTYLSALYTSVYLGGRTDFFMKFPWALEYGLNYNFYNYFKSDFGILGRNNDLSYTKMGDSFFTTAFSVPASRLTVMSLRFNIGDNNLRYYQLPNYSDNDIMDQTKFKFAGAKFEIERNNLNYLMFPTRGIRQSISAAYVMGIENYNPGTFSPAGSQRMEAHRQWYVGHFSREHYYQFGKALSLGYLVEATYSNQPNFSNEYSTNITSPAFYPTAHSRMVYMKDYHSDKYVGVGLMPSLIFGSKMYLKSGIYAFLSGEKNLLTNNYDNDIRWIFTSALVYQTPIGPASLTLSKYNAQTNSNWFLTFNFGYILFNKRALFY